MAKLFGSRSAQWPLAQEFTFNFNDWAADSVDGVKKTFGAAVTNSGATNAVDPVTGETISGLTSGTGIVLDCIPMPNGAYINDVKVFVETAYAGIGASATISLGISGNTTAIVNAQDLDAATAGTQITVASFSPVLCNSGQNIRLTIAGMTATATAGKVRVRVQYTIDNRANEAQVN